jgi:hypothetical protein
MNWKNTPDEALSAYETKQLIGYAVDVVLDEFLEAKNFNKTGKVESDKTFQLIDSPPYDVLTVGGWMTTNAALKLDDPDYEPCLDDQRNPIEPTGETYIELFNTSGTLMDTVRIRMNGFSDSMMQAILEDQSNDQTNRNLNKIERLKEIVKNSDLSEAAKASLEIRIGYDLKE